MRALFTYPLSVTALLISAFIAVAQDESGTRRDLKAQPGDVTCSPQPLCQINHPPIAPGSTPAAQNLGGENAIINKPNSPIVNAMPQSNGGNRICLPWC
jgi:hypothetical protein